MVNTDCKDDDMRSAYPLSPLQMGMLYHAIREPGSGIDIEQILFTLCEPLDLAVWERAWTALLQRYDIFRTRFQWEDVDAPVQIVEPNVPVRIVVEEWGECAWGRAREAVMRVAKSRSSHRLSSDTGATDALSLYAAGRCRDLFPVDVSPCIA